MGCTASRSVVPEPITALSKQDVVSASQSAAVTSGITKVEVMDAVVELGDFAEQASVALDAVAASPDAVATFAQVLEDNAGDIKSALCDIVGAASVAASVLASMTPAAVIAAPALAAVRALASQVAQMRENIGLAESLRTELAYADTLLLHAGRSEMLAKDHAPLINVICGAARDASALVSRISRRGVFMSFVAAGIDGAKLRDALAELHKRFTALGTAAAVASAAGISELPSLLVEKARVALCFHKLVFINFP